MLNEKTGAIETGSGTESGAPMAHPLDGKDDNYLIALGKHAALTRIANRHLEMARRELDGCRGMMRPLSAGTIARVRADFEAAVRLLEESRPYAEICGFM